MACKMRRRRLRASLRQLRMTSLLTERGAARRAQSISGDKQTTSRRRNEPKFSPPEIPQATFEATFDTRTSSSQIGLSSAHPSSSAHTSETLQRSRRLSNCPPIIISRASNSSKPRRTAPVLSGRQKCGQNQSLLSILRVQSVH